MPAMPLLKHILHPTDFSEASLSATEVAVGLAKKFHAKLHLVHVIEDPLLALPVLESIPLPDRHVFETYAQDRLENWIPVEDRDDLDFEVHWYHGVPVARILEFATDHRMDLIVLCSQGRGEIASSLMGALTARVMRQAPCPVLMVPVRSSQNRS